MDVLPAPLGVYIHWPYCARICPYCDFNVVRERGRTMEQAALVDAIAADLMAQAAMLGPRTLVSVYLGGGTPSLMMPEQAGRLIALCKALWPATDTVGTDAVEVTLEANPGDADEARLVAFRGAGVGRLSLGVQALNDTDLAFLGRNHDAATARHSIAAAVGVFPRLSLDLIYALPGQTEGAWRTTLAETAGFGVEHISAYELTIEAGTPFDRAVRRGRFSPADEVQGAAFYEATNTALNALGFEAYEVSNYARGAEAQARHNLVYWRGEDYVGAGPGAHGRLTLGQGRHATEAERKVGNYIARVNTSGVGFAATPPLTATERAEERVFMGLRTFEGVAVGDLAPLPLGRLPDLIGDGLLVQRQGRLIATPRGRLLLNRVCEALAN